MSTYENEEYIIGGTNNTDGTHSYHILWLDTGARACGFVSRSEALKNADRICARAEVNRKASNHKRLVL